MSTDFYKILMIRFCEPLECGEGPLYALCGNAEGETEMAGTAKTVAWNDQNIMLLRPAAEG